MKMKLGIAVALSHDPKLLILDEATSGLDPVVRDDFMDVLMDFTRDETHSVLISSHIVSDLEKVCDYVAFLHKGKLVLSEEKDALKEKYGVIHVTPDTLESIPNKAIIGKRVSPYNIEAMVERAFVPAGTVVYPADIEQLFVFMVKGEE
jgi:ABC-2 type transport system ATP-binding protein